MTGEWRRLRNEDLHGLYDSPGVVKIMKSRRLMWADYVARMGEKRRLYSTLVGLEGRMEGYHWEDRDVVWRTILKEIFER